MGLSVTARQWLDENLGYVGAALAYIVAGIHLFHPKLGFPRLVLLLATGNAQLLINDPRPLVFVMSALAIIAGITLAIFDADRAWMYPLGMTVVAAYFVGYFAWHFSGHGGFLPGREPLHHGLNVVDALVSHLSFSRTAAVSKVAELALLVVLGVLYRRKL
jgi:hypothetical protein